MPAFLLPLLMAAGGAGIGALSNKENRLKGALFGAGLGALGGAGLGAAGVGSAGAAGSGAFIPSTASIGQMASGAAPVSLGSYAPAAASKGIGLSSLMKNAAPFAKLIGQGQQQPEQNQYQIGSSFIPMPISSLSQPAWNEQMVPPVQNYGYRGY